VSYPKSIHKRMPSRLPSSLGFSRYALDFDGVDDTVLVPHDASLNDVFGSTTHTLMAWVYPREFVDFNGLIGKKDSNAYDDHPAGIFPDSKGFHYVVADGTTRDDIRWEPPLNAWYHVAGVCDGNDLYLYGNGEQRATTPLTASPATNTDPLRIGYFYGQDYHNGLVADIRVIAAPLSAEEVREAMLDYHRSVDPANLAGWWRFEEGTDLTAHDGSGNGNDGTLKPSGDPPTWVEQEKWEMRAGAGL